MISSPVFGGGGRVFADGGVMGSTTEAHDPSVAARRRHLPRRLGRVASQVLSSAAMMRSRDSGRSRSLTPSA